MLTLREILLFVNANDPDTLKAYYDKCYDTLKEINKRSNVITFIILIIFALYSFSSYIRESDVLGFKIDKNVVKITSPLLLSYFVLEWCFIARRRRELMKIMKHVGIKIFNLPAIWDDFLFPHFGIHSRNVMPFSLLVELLNVDFKNKIHAWLFLLFVFFVFSSTPFFIGYCLYISVTQFTLTWQIIGCNIIGLFCLLQIVLFYINEITTMRKITSDDEAYKEELIELSIRVQQQPSA